jgi:hypothetical protein
MKPLDALADGPLAHLMLLPMLPLLSTPADPYTLSYLGAAINVIVASAVGVVGGFAHKGEPDRMRLFGCVAIYTLLASACVTLVPLWWGWEIEPIARPPLAVVFGFAARFLVPVFTEYAPALFKTVLMAWATRAGQASPAPKGDDP